MTYSQAREHKCWAELCQMLRETGAVTSTDCASAREKQDTPGQRLFAKLREWGNLNRIIGIDEARR